MNQKRMDRIRRFRSVVRQCRYRLAAVEASHREQQFTRTEWEIWQEIAHPQGSTSARVVGLLGLDRGLVSRILQRWEQHENLIHTAPLPRNRRIKAVLLSDIGRQRDRAIEAVATRAALRVLGRLNEDEQEELIDALARAERLLTRAEIHWHEMTHPSHFR